ncbi:MAG: SUMF1/EgtB/PvdO family nonheme iron enzyme [Acidobacteriota bacterium]|nr:SUMF1/EgtB/PvdO family nonheme iron enzyme [Acidobacteriota bacterium]
MPGTPASATEISSDLLARLADARRRTDDLFGVVKERNLYERPIPERHRIVFYIGHLEAFDWNLLREAVRARPPWNPDFDRLFAFGIDPVDGGLPSDQPRDWPAIDIVRRYTSEVREALDASLEHASRVADGDTPLDRLLHVAIEHRLMHEETLSYMLHCLPLDQKQAVGQTPSPAASAFRPGMIEIPAGRATLGLSRGGATFGWDNEFEEHEVDVPPFRIDRCMVTNGEFLAFIDALGYERLDLWTAENWRWRSECNITHPAFWKREGGLWLWRGMFANIPLPLDWPVYVSHAEAAAYARWAGKSLPTEAQWHRAAYGTPEGGERRFPWGDDPPSPRVGNFDFERWDPVPVGAHPESRSAFGVEGLLGNGWEWTSSVFAPFPGFRSFPFYPGYSANFFDGKHFTMKGGSSRTATCMLRRSFRNWFQARYQYVYAGFRCVSA